MVIVYLILVAFFGLAGLVLAGLAFLFVWIPATLAYAAREFLGRWAIWPAAALGLAVAIWLQVAAPAMSDDLRYGFWTMPAAAAYAAWYHRHVAPGRARRRAQHRAEGMKMPPPPRRATGAGERQAQRMKGLS